MRERFIRFTVEGLMFCYDTDKNYLMIDDKNGKYRMEIPFSLNYIINVTPNVLDKINDYFALQDEITTLGNIRVDIEDTLSKQFYNLTITLSRLENMRDELGNEIKEGLK